MKMRTVWVVLLVLALVLLLSSQVVFQTNNLETDLLDAEEPEIYLIGGEEEPVELEMPVITE